MEQYALYLLLAAAALFAVGFLWLVVAAFRVRLGWGLGLLILPPLAVFFIPRYWKQSRGPLTLALLAGVLAAGTYGLAYYERIADLGPRERVIEGERHITLTGWDGTDYAILKQKPDTVVLQIANVDVTDATLENLRGMGRLRELDLNNSTISDEGLALLAALPALQELRLARTGITDEGFQKHLAGKESLRMVDLTDTPVKGKTKRDWRKAQPGREYLD
jgi:hypothetical protein